MKKPIIAAAAALGLVGVAAVIKLALPSKPHSGSNDYLDSATAAEPIPGDALVDAANAILAASDKVIDADGAFVTRNAAGGLELYGQVTSSAAAGSLARRIRALDPEVDAASHFKVGKRN